MALCALLHSFMPDKVPYEHLKPGDKRRNFNAAFEAAETVGIPTTLVRAYHTHLTHHAHLSATFLP